MRCCWPTPPRFFTKLFHSSCRMGSRRICPHHTHVHFSDCVKLLWEPTVPCIFQEITAEPRSSSAETQRGLYLHASAAKHVFQDRWERQNSRKYLQIQGVSQLHRQRDLFVFHPDNVGLETRTQAGLCGFDVAWKRAVCNLGITASVNNEFPAERRAERSSDNWPNYCK